MKGKRVRTLKGLAALVRKRKAVVGNAVWCRRYIPAAMVINMPGSVILVGIRAGMWEYRKKEE